MIQTKIAAVQGQYRYCVYLPRRQQRVLVTLSSHNEAIDSTTLAAPTHRDRPRADTFYGNEGAKDLAVSGKLRQKRLQQIQLITETCHGVML